MSKTNGNAKILSNNRIIIDNTNLNELKTTCDEAVERILTQSSISSSLAPAPGVRSPTESGASSPTSATSPSSSTASLHRLPNDLNEAFPPFKALHFHTDLRLVLGFIASIVMIGTSAWAYLIEKDWQKNKHVSAIAVVVYVLLSGIIAFDNYRQGSVIFIGRRKMLAKRIETEQLKISSPSLPKPITSKNAGPDGKFWTIPPVYTLIIDYTRKSNGGKSLLRECHQKKVEMGNLGEWFTEEGEFCQEIFAQRLISGLEKAFGL